MKYHLFIALLVLSACSGSELQQLGGLSYSLESEDCQAPEGDYLLMHTKVRTQTDSIVLNTRELGRHLEVKLSKMDSTSSLYQLLNSMCQDDSLHMQLSADSFYQALGSKAPNFLQGQPLLVDIRLSERLDEIKYQVNKQLFERRTMKRYVDHYGWLATLDSATGIYYEVMSTARSRSRSFTKAHMSYLIKTLSDRPVAYSKDGEPWLFDKADEDMLAGLRFVGGLLKEQERIRALIPSTMAYGAEGLGQVGPFQPIIVEMELLEIIE